MAASDGALAENRRILIVDDNADIHEDFRKILIGGSARATDIDQWASALFGNAAAAAVEIRFDITFALQGEEAVEIARKAAAAGQPFAMAFVDIRMPPGWDGVDTLRHLWETDPEVQAVICTAYSDYSWQDMVNRLGDTDRLLILKKPYEPIEVRQMASALTKKWNLTRRIAEQARNLRITLDSIGDAVIAVDAEGRLTRMNPVAEGYLGWNMSEAEGKPLDDLMHLVTREGKRPVPLAELIGMDAQTGALPAETLLLASRDGTERSVSDRASPIRTEDGSLAGHVLVLRDVTLQAQLEERLRQSQKMDALGRLAGGIAHDFNNMLGGIMGAADILQMHLPEASENHKYVNLILNTADSASQLVDKLLTFSRKSALSEKAFDMHAAIADAVAILERSVDRRIVIETALEARMSRIHGDPAQLQSAILNLGLNARDAMPGGGRLRIATSNTDFHGQFFRVGGDNLPPGQYLQIDVSDEGCGIQPGLLRTIFEPFFTTKEVGKGTGLGLAAVYGTVKDHQGTVSVESEPGKGTTFRLWLPVTHEEVHRESGRLGKTSREHGLILIVEDEPAIRQTLDEGLRACGYETLAAEDGAEAISLFHEHGDNVDAVILDMTLPKLSGPEVLRTLRALNPRLRILVASGLTATPALTEHETESLSGFIKKPYRLEELRHALSEAMSRPAPGE